MQPGDSFGRYEVLSELGSGGMAVVFRVRHGTLGSEHALKVLRIASPPLRARLLQEAHGHSTLRHPNVVMVSDLVETDAGIGLVMELVDGPDLETWLQGRGPLDLETRARAALADVGLAEAPLEIRISSQSDITPQLVAQLEAAGLSAASSTREHADLRFVAYVKALRRDEPVPFLTRLSTWGHTPESPAQQALAELRRDALTVPKRADRLAIYASLEQAVLDEGLLIPIAVRDWDSTTTLHVAAPGVRGLTDPLTGGLQWHGPCLPVALTLQE